MWMCVTVETHLICYDKILYAGHGEGASGVRICCFRTGCDDSRALLFRPQRCVSIGTAEGVQSQESVGLPLRHLLARINGMLLFCYRSFLIDRLFIIIRQRQKVHILQTLLCGLIGLPPSNGVLPQSPMHTKSLAVLREQVCAYEEEEDSEFYLRVIKILLFLSC